MFPTMRYLSGFLERKSIEWQLGRYNLITMFIISSLLALALNLNIFAWKRWAERTVTSVIALIISSIALDICAYLFFSLELITVQNMVYNTITFDINNCQYILYESMRFTGLVIGMFQIMFFAGFYYLTLRHSSGLKNIWSRRLIRRVLFFLWAYYLSFLYLYAFCTPVEMHSYETPPVCKCGLILLNGLSMRTIFRGVFLIPLFANILLIKKIYLLAENPAPVKWRFYRRGLKRTRFQAAVRRKAKTITIVTVVMVLVFSLQWLFKKYLSFSR